MTRYDLSPLFSSTVGFDRLARLLEQIPDPSETLNSYPPYDIEVIGDDHYRITMAVAGFTQEMLDIEYHDNTLTIKGSSPDSKEERQFLHHGIGNRTFERKFQLDDYVQVTEASLKDGLLVLDLVREIPEEMKPRTIEISKGKSQTLIEQSEDSKSKAA